MLDNIRFLLEHRKALAEASDDPEARGYAMGMTNILYAWGHEGTEAPASVDELLVNASGQVQAACFSYDNDHYPGAAMYRGAMRAMQEACRVLGAVMDGAGIVEAVHVHKGITEYTAPRRCFDF